MPLTDSVSGDAEMSAEDKVSENMLTNAEIKHQGQFLLLCVHVFIEVVPNVLACDPREAFQISLFHLKEF